MLRIPYGKRLMMRLRSRWRIITGKTAGIFPGRCTDRHSDALDESEDIIAHNRDVIVVVVEAYIDFWRVSALPLVEKYDNLLIVTDIFQIAFHGRNAHRICDEMRSDPLYQ